jgi:hypothetical protein
MDFMFNGLTKKGYVAGESEIEDIAELIFDFLLEIGIIGEVEDDE